MTHPELRERLVTKLPLERLWGGDFDCSNARRCDWLAADAVAQLLSHAIVRFVVADVGQRLRWIDTGDCYRFWRAEAKPHIADPASAINLEAFPGGYAYLASEWRLEAGDAIVVFEKFH